MTREADWDALIRAEFPVAARVMYAGRANPLFVCRRATEEAQRYFASAGADLDTREPEWRDEIERVRTRMAAVLRVDAREVAFVSDVGAIVAAASSRGHASIRVADVSLQFGMSDASMERVAGDLVVVAAHGVYAARVPRGLLDVPAADAVDAPSPPRAGILALGGAVDVLAEIGVDIAIARVRDLVTRLREALDRHAVAVAWQDDRTVVATGLPAHAIATLRAAGIVASQEREGVGISVHLFTRIRDVNTIAAALAAIARGETAVARLPPDGPLVCVDLNGVLDAYEGWQGPEHWDPPAAGASEFLAALRARGSRVVLFTTRYYRDAWQWLEAHGLGEFVDAVTDRKPAADVFVDDRAVSFQGDYSAALRQVDQFAPHWQRHRL